MQIVSWIQTFPQTKGGNMRGDSLWNWAPYLLFTNTLYFCSYINQYQSLLSEEGRYPSRHDREVYALAELTAKGERPDWEDNQPEEAFVNYVKLSAPSYLDHYFRIPADRKRSEHSVSFAAGSHSATTTYNYEKYLRGGLLTRKTTGDSSASWFTNYEPFLRYTCMYMLYVCSSLYKGPLAYMCNWL